MNWRITERRHATEAYCAVHNVDCPLHGASGDTEVFVKPGYMPAPWMCPHAVAEFIELVDGDVPPRLEELIDRAEGIGDIDLNEVTLDVVYSALEEAQAEDTFERFAGNDVRATDFRVAKNMMEEYYDVLEFDDSQIDNAIEEVSIRWKEER